MKWVTDGDADTKFFHANTTIKHRRNLITSLVYKNGTPLICVTARGPFGPDRICDTVAKGYCSVTGTVAAAQYFPVSPIPETEREADQVK